MAKKSLKTPDLNQELIAIAFDKKGQQIGFGTVSSEAASFDLSTRTLGNARIFILPKPPSERFNVKELSLEQAERLKAFEPYLKFGKKGVIIFDKIPDGILDFFWWRKCNITGTIKNTASVEGRQETYPVCEAIVHICEVDRWPIWIRRIPEEILVRLKHGLMEKIPLGLPTIESAKFRSFPHPNLSDEATPSFNSSQFISRDFELIQQPQGQIIEQLSRYEGNSLRDYLQREYLTIWPYLCYFPYVWPYFYHCDEIATVKTDSNGRFEACLWYQWDQPDVYIWVEYPFHDGIKTVYRPHIVCNTYWNYACGTDINIHLYNQKIPPSCGIPLIGKSIAVRSIGHSVSPMAIQQDSNDTISIPGKSNFKTVGLTNYHTSHLSGYSPSIQNQPIRPYTGTFPIHAQFGDALPDSGVKYFKLEYRRTHDAALNQLINPASLYSGWKSLSNTSLSRRYSIQVGLDFQYLYYDLGPFKIGSKNVYRIPPLDPQLAGVDGIPASTDPTARWSRYDKVTIGYIDSNSLSGDGLYEFRISFLNGSGQVANVNADFFRVPNPADSDETIAAPVDYVRHLGSRAVFQFKLRIDNQAPDIAIEAADLDGDQTLMSPCGFLEYENSHNNVGITFEASHPHDFALFSFDLERGRPLATGNHLTLADAKGIVSGSKAPYTLRPDGKYNGNFSITSLLSGCGDKAAFSEVLSINGLHTDGYRAGNLFHKRISNAFALAKK